jgi:hypothetical protein
MEAEIKKAFETFLPVFEFGLQKLTGSERRIYLAEIATRLGYGGMKLVNDHFDIDYKTLQKGMEELESGNYIIDAFDKRGRKGIEAHLPNILYDIKSIVDSESQTDPRFEDSRLFTRLTPENIKMQLHKKGYKLEELPTSKTIYNKVNELGYSFSTIQKTKPIKKIAETDAIFKKNKASQ